MSASVPRTIAAGGENTRLIILISCVINGTVDGLKQTLQSKMSQCSNHVRGHG